MSDIIGRGVIELVADATAFKVTMDDAKKSIKDLGESQGSANASASKSIDAYVQRLQFQAATIGKSSEETKLYSLATRGASEAQLAAATIALQAAASHKETAATLDKLRSGFILLGEAAVIGLVGAAVAWVSSLRFRNGRFTQ